MTPKTLPTINRVTSGGYKCDKTEKEFSNHNLFKPPKFDTSYFHYTEIISDWIAMRK